MNTKTKEAVLCVGLYLLIVIAAHPFIEFHIAWHDADIESREHYGMGIMEWGVLPHGDEYEINITEGITSLLALMAAAVIYMKLRQP